MKNVWGRSLRTGVGLQLEHSMVTVCSMPRLEASLPLTQTGWLGILPALRVQHRHRKAPQWGERCGLHMRYVLLDRITALEPPEGAAGVKCVSLSDDIFVDHFPG